MTIWKYKYDRGVDTSALKVTITVEGRHGVIGLAGIAPASGFEDGIINAGGDLKALDGSDYKTGAARPGLDPVPDYYRLTVRKNGLPISSVVFQPVLATVSATDLDINALVRIGKAIALSPEQLADLEGGLTSLSAALTQAATDHAAAVQSLADNAQDRLLTQQATDAANAAAAALGATGLLYLGLDDSGAANVATLLPSTITLTTETIPFVGVFAGVPNLEVS